MLTCDACAETIHTQPMFAQVSDEFQKVRPGITHLCAACRIYCDDQLQKMRERVAKQNEALRAETYAGCIDTLRGRVS